LAKTEFMRDDGMLNITESDKCGKKTTLPMDAEDATREALTAALTKKRQVESCLQLDIHKLMRLGIVREGAHTTGSLQWHNLVAGTVAGECRYWVDCRRTDAAALGIKYQVQDGGQVMTMIGLTPTRPNYGGVRWWFRCPVKALSGRRCGRRVGKLYLPPGEAYFACRECHELTYQCRQEHKCGMEMLGAVAERTGREVADMRRMMKPQLVLQRA
jgi:hypothetical protein